MILMIDNYDSFSHNLARYISLASNQSPEIIKNDELSSEDLRQLSPDYLILSPGPSCPDQSGLSMAAIELFKDKCPILGVCLGHQCIGQYFGATITKSKKILHGKTSMVSHHNDAIFKDLPSPFIATRYHSLVISSKSLPESLNVLASSNDEIMAIKHKQLPIYGIQFHPEAHLTSYGLKIIQNFFE